MSEDLLWLLGAAAIGAAGYGYVTRDRRQLVRGAFAGDERVQNLETLLKRQDELEKEIEAYMARR